MMALAGCGSGSGGDDDAPPPAPPPPVTFTVAGVLSVGEGQVLDGDTNDPNDPVIENNTVASGGQLVAIPAIIGGYASTVGDPLDIYRVNLQGGGTVVLSIADARASDLDLYVTDTDGMILQRSIGTGSLELIDMDPSMSGDVLIAVRAFSGASNYVLSIGVAAATAAIRQALAQDFHALPIDADFEPEALVVKFKATTDVGPSAMRKAQMAAMAAHFGLSPKLYSPSGPILMDARQVDTSAFMALRASQDAAFPLYDATPAEAAKARTLAVIKALRRDDAIAYAEPNYLYQPMLTPNDEFFGFQWHYPLMNLPQAWEISQGVDDVVVAVIDTGVVTTHPDLSSRLLRDAAGNVIGYDFISDAERARDGDGIDPDPFDSGDLIFGGSSSFHGTHVAGIIGATTDNRTGVAGVTWAGRLMPLRVLGQGGGSNFDIAQAILYAAGAPNISETVPEVAADVMNLSLGTNNPDCLSLPPLDRTTADALQTAQQAGVVVVAAAGNDNCDVPSPMSMVDGVINVSAVDLHKRKAPYSNTGTTIDVAAPGGDTSADRDGNGVPDGVFSTLADDSRGGFQATYDIAQGTSMAAPHMAGVVALMSSVNASLTPDDINMLLAGTHPDPNAAPITQDLGPPGRDPIFGYGFIDAFQAVRVAQAITGGGGGNPPPPDIPVLSVSATQLSFGAMTMSLPLIISNPGTGDLIVSGIEVDVPWVGVDGLDVPFSLPPTATTEFTLTVDRAGLPNGAFFGTLTLTSNGGIQTVRLAIIVQPGGIGGDVGTVFVLAIDPDSQSTMGQTLTHAAQGYVYELPGLTAGSYLIVAGTDRNNDGFICDAGEACGLFPIIDSPVVLEVNQDNMNIDFAVSYDFSVLGSAAQQYIFSYRPGARYKRLDAVRDE